MPVSGWRPRNALLRLLPKTRRVQNIPKAAGLGMSIRIGAAQNSFSNTGYSATFPIIQREEEAQFNGRFRSRDLILGYMAAFGAGDPDSRISV